MIGDKGVEFSDSTKALEEIISSDKFPIFIEPVDPMDPDVENIEIIHNDDTPSDRLDKINKM